MRRRIVLLTLVATAAFAPGRARAQCLEWRAVGDAPAGANGTVRTLLSLDDGTGPALYAGGEFTQIGGQVARVARWNGQVWQAVGDQNPFTAIPVNVLSTIHDGPSVKLIAGLADGTAPRSLLRLDGTNWTTLANVGSGNHAQIYALAELIDGGERRLFIGGDFSNVDNLPFRHVARRSSTGWSAAGLGFNAFVRALATYDDGGGPHLFAAGHFTNSADYTQSYGRVARWSGGGWVDVGGGVDSTVYCMAGFDAGSGAELYVGGSFLYAGNMRVNRIARWNGSVWSPVGQGLNAIPFAMTVFDDGSGLALYVAGNITSAGGVPVNHIARWNGSEWSAVGGGVDGPVLALSTHQPASGRSTGLYAGGIFDSAGAKSVGHLATYRTCAQLTYCDSPTIACPCSDGSLGHGCENASATGGVRLEVLSVIRDHPAGQLAWLLGTGFNPSAASATIVLRGDAVSPASASAFGDGVLCLSPQSVVRIGVATAQDGLASYSVVHGAGPGSFGYQIWYRDNPASYCTPAAFNLSSGVGIEWL